VLIFLAVVTGLATGPSLHHLAVQSGVDLELNPLKSTCPSCSANFSWLSWRCPGCGLVRWRELAVAAMAAAGMAGMAWRLGASWVLPAHLFMVAVTSILVVTDLDHFRIPNRVLFPGTAVAALLLSVGALADGDGQRLPGALIGAVAYYGLLFLVFLAAGGRGFGFGDVKLAALLGLFTAYHTWQTLALALAATAALGGLPAMVLLLLGKGRKAEIPYGPPLILGAWVAIIFGSSFFAWYLR
jgi:leader peptidase (prepilin peptidase) / N-methyltransferase